MLMLLLLDASSSGLLDSDFACDDVLDGLANAGPITECHERNLGILAPPDEI